MIFSQEVYSYKSVVLRLCVVVMFVLMCQDFYAQPAYNVQTKAGCNEMFFASNSSRINNEVAQALKVYIDDYVRHNNIDSVSIYISTHTSFEGNWSLNNRLSHNRSASIQNYIYSNYPVLQQCDITIESKGEDWEGFLEMVATDSLIPFRNELLKIANDNTIEQDKKEVEIKKLGEGKTYSYLERHILPSQRRAVVCLVSPALKEPITPQLEQLEDKPEFDSIDSFDRNQISGILTDPIWILDKFWAIKTNLAQLGIGIANLGVEIPIGNHFSIDIPFTFSPYTVSNSWRMRTLSLQPEFRWWLNKQMQGHFLGLHGQVAYYNVSWNNEDRYQDKNGDTPLWGGGISYGYAVPFSKHWGMEFTLGGGYSRLVYDVFYNVENGAKYTTETKNYWGITRAGITLIYKFNK